MTTDLVQVMPTKTLRLFARPGAELGGHPTPVFLDADQFDFDVMQSLAKSTGRESVFVCRPTNSTHSFHFKYFVPMHEMEMCGHATIGALWLLQKKGLWNGSLVAVRTKSGLVQGRNSNGLVEITQPKARIDPVSEQLTREIADCLGLDVSQLIGPVINSATSRVKTLICLRDVETLDALKPHFERVEGLCDRLGSTGLYPFAVASTGLDYVEVSARQFQQASGYPECPATGIAGTALAWGLRHLGLVGDGQTEVRVRQGEAMGHPSLILVDLPSTESGQAFCWLRGNVQEM